jgi:hypothetical protein
VTYDNDGRFPDGATVQARYLDAGRRSGSDRDAWPWLDATVEQQCGRMSGRSPSRTGAWRSWPTAHPRLRAPRMTSCCSRCASAMPASCASPASGCARTPTWTAMACTGWSPADHAAWPTGPGQDREAGQ